MYLIFWKDVYLLICFKRSRFLSFIQRHLYLLARAAVSECQMRVMEQQKRVAWQFWGPQVWGQDTGRLGSPWRLCLRLVDGCPIWFSLYVLQLMRSVCPNLLLSDWIRAHPKGLICELHHPVKALSSNTINSDVRRTGWGELGGYSSLHSESQQALESIYRFIVAKFTA